MNIVTSLQETDEAVAHFSRALAENDSDDILRINAESVVKRQRDLSRRLNHMLSARQAELIRYRVERDQFIGRFQASLRGLLVAR